MRKVLVSEECDTFMLNSSKRVQDKFDYLLTVISQEQIVSKNFVDKLVGTDYYELRIKAENQVRVVVFSIDNLNFNLSKRVILLNAFIKKSTKDYKPAIAIADKLFNKYKDEIMGKLKTADEILDKKYGKVGTESRAKFNEEAYAWYFAEILKNRREELNLSQEELAQKVGKESPYISKVENGEDISISNLVHLAKVLGLTFELKPSL